MARIVEPQPSRAPLFNRINRQKVPWPTRWMSPLMEWLREPLPPQFLVMGDRAAFGYTPPPSWPGSGSQVAAPLLSPGTGRSALAGPMPSVMARCQTNDLPVRIGIETDAVSFATLRIARGEFDCPSCGKTHRWLGKDAWLAGVPPPGPDDA